MRRTEERLIGEHRYRVQQLELNAALDILPLVLRVAGPTIASLLEGTKSLSEALESDARSLSAAVREFTKSLSGTELVALSDALMKGDAAKVFLGNAWVPLESVARNHFPPRYSEWLQWLVFSARVNFESFLGGLGSVESALAQLRKAPASESQTASTGTSGGS